MNPLNKRNASPRRGFAIIFVLWFISLAGLTLLAISGRVASDVKRTKQQQADAQIAQWLTTGAILATQPNWLPADSADVDRTIVLPTDGPEDANLYVKGSRSQQGVWELTLTVEHRRHRGQQTLQLLHEGGQTKVVEVRRSD